jgi:DNA-binding NarL/FixJ family response regulator
MTRHHKKKLKPARLAKRRIYLVDDHPVTRAGLARLINLEPDLEMCGEAGSAAQAVAGVEALKPDLVIVDISLAGGPGGLELIKDLAARNSRLKMLAFSTHDETLYAERALRAGATGYVMKQELTEDIMQAIRRVLAGEIYASGAMKDRMLRKMTERQSPPLASEIELLSDRELEVFRLLGRGLGTRQVAAQLHVSISTVETHRSHIKEKLHLHRAPELVQRAVEWVQSQAH